MKARGWNKRLEQRTAALSNTPWGGVHRRVGPAMLPRQWDPTPDLDTGLGLSAPHWELPIQPTAPAQGLLYSHLPTCAKVTSVSISLSPAPCAGRSRCGSVGHRCGPWLQDPGPADPHCANLRLTRPWPWPQGLALPVCSGFPGPDRWPSVFCLRCLSPAPQGALPRLLQDVPAQPPSWPPGR